MSAFSLSQFIPALAASQWAGPGSWWQHGPGAWWYGPGAWWPTLPLLWLAVIAIAMTAAVLLIRRNSNRPGSHTTEMKLAELFATGGITEDEYSKRLAVLRAHGR